MENLHLGSRFSSYKEIIQTLNQYCQETNTKFWKQYAHTLKTVFGENVVDLVRKELIYYEVTFVCVKSSTKIETDGSRKPNCPAYFKFKIAEGGLLLELIAMNINHKHEIQKRVVDNTEPITLKRKNHDNYLTPLKQRRSSLHDSEVEYIELHFDDDNADNYYSVEFTFRGLIAPTFTPYNEDMSLNLNVIVDYAQFLSNSGISGVLINGTTGEGMSMNVNERKQITEEWAKAVLETDQHLMVQIGGAALPDVIELAKHAEQFGVHSLLCLPDLYNKPTNSSDLIRYLKIVSEAAPNTSLLYYHIPNYTNVNIHMGEFLNDATDKISTFRGIKFTSTNLDEGIAAVKANSGKYAVFLGADQLMAGAYTLGFDSAIATTLNIFPQLGIDVLEAVKQSKFKEAKQAQDLLTDICSIITTHGGWVPTMKVAMNLFSPVNVGRTREPLNNPTDEQIKEMTASLKSFNLHKK